MEQPIEWLGNIKHKISFFRNSKRNFLESFETRNFAFLDGCIFAHSFRLHTSQPINHSNSSFNSYTNLRTSKIRGVINCIEKTSHVKKSKKEIIGNKSSENNNLFFTFFSFFSLFFLFFSLFFFFTFLFFFFHFSFFSLS